MKWEDFLKPKPAAPDFTVALDPAVAMTNRQIYDAFRAAGMTAEGACGLMGNMQAESGMVANIAQRGMTPLSDADYTAAADNGTIDFVNDAVGYGYIQLTYHTRKAKYLAYCKQLGKSVGDAKTQIDFIILELTADYPMVMLTLRTSHDMYECTKQVCEKYENPAVKNTDTRYHFAQQFYDEFCGSSALADAHAAQAPTLSTPDACPVFPPDPSVMVIQMVMTYNGYWGKPDGYKSPEFFSALREFTSDMEKC